MPKETIRTRADGRTTDGFAVKVGWEAHLSGEVQIGVEHDEFRSLVWALFGPGSSTDPLDSAPTVTPLVKVGQAVHEGIARYRAENDDAAPNDYYLGQLVLNALDVVATYSGVWTDLDRKGINDLIRVLRRARDAAFGRDE
jgi:hypothetical protein